MIDYKRVIKDGSRQVFTSDTAMQLKATLKDDSDKASVAFLGGGLGTYLATSWATTSITDSLFAPFGYSGDTMTLAMNLGIVGLVAGGGAYAFTQIPNKQDAKIETRKPVSVIEEELKPDNQAFTKLCENAVDSPFLFISATSGSGKTVWLNNLVDNHLPEDAEYIVLDGKPEGVASKRWVNAHTTILDKDKFEPALKNVVALMHRRQQNSHIRNTTLYVIIDEFTVLSDEAVDHVKVLLTQSRSENIKVFLATQSPSAALNSTNGLTTLFNALPTISLDFNEAQQRVISVAKINNGKIKNIGKEVLIPQLRCDWNDDLPYQSDVHEFDFVTPDKEYYDNMSEKLHAPTTTTTKTPPKGQETTQNAPESGGGGGEISMNTLLRFAEMVTQKTDTDLDNEALQYVTQIGSAIMDRIKQGETLSKRGIQDQMGMKYDGGKNKTIQSVVEYMEVV